MPNSNRDSSGRWSSAAGSSQAAIADPNDIPNPSTTGALINPSLSPRKGTAAQMPSGAPSIPDFDSMPSIQAQLADVGSSGSDSGAGGSEPERYEMPEDEQPADNDADRMTMRGGNEIGSRHYSFSNDAEAPT